MTMAIMGTDSDMHTGPAFLASGSKAVYDLVEPMLNKVAAEANHHACAGYIGKVMRWRLERVNFWRRCMI